MIRKSESGQAIVLLVFAVVGLIGFTALAIDGGMLFADRRHAQSASDAASLAGGGFAALALENYFIDHDNFDCDNPQLNPSNPNPNSLVNQAVTVALNRAFSNDYTSAQVTVTAECEDEGPIFDEKYLEITTHITRETKTSLIHFVFNGPTVNQVESTVRVRPRTPLALGNAILALNEAGCYGNQNGVILGGSSGTFLHDGGIFSNGCLKCDGSATSHEVVVEPNPPYGIYFVDTSMGCGLNELDPPADTFPNPIPQEFWDIDPPPDCSGLDNYSMNDFDEDEEGWVTLLPGIYNKIDDGSIEKIRFEPGLYCVTGSPNAIKISTAYFEGIYVTFYVTNGGVQITGTGDEDQRSILQAPPQNSNSAPALDGVLIYLAHGNDSNIKITGNAYSEFTGTIFAPDGDIEVIGTGDTTAPFGTQLIGQNVRIGGNAFIDINFLDDVVDENPAWIDLTR